MTDERARALLTEYFEYRAASFPQVGGYVTHLPAPDAFTPPAGQFILAVGETGEEYGCGALRRLDDDVLGLPARSVWEVKHLFVRPGARGAGAGRALLSELERRARDFGAQTVVLDTNASLTAANALYLSSGYRSIPPYNDNGNATTWYRKDL